MIAETTVHLPRAAWGLILAVVVLVAVAAGLPALLRGGRSGGRGRGRRGYRVRVGPSLPLVLALGLARRLDAVLLALVAAAFVVAVALNATA
ncbi:hypothetical protein DZF91_03230 [Actinomadura logoneensis]|uniref:Uncharacterized protein n=1 Tax=Actinomadura logoneensis TaxID=2293572 RepID=A0A372JTH1_9ACTN|nr:hypothetical protein [Actinomadura logoneensis]RFU43064.1 hypothetical protein DZF91_03230 [Actinomadura logoneensis]